MIKKQVNIGKAVFYIGFDPTADSLHVGHFMALCLMKDVYKRQLIKSPLQNRLKLTASMQNSPVVVDSTDTVSYTHLILIMMENQIKTNRSMV